MASSSFLARIVPACISLMLLLVLMERKFFLVIASEIQEIPNMEASVLAVENLLGYRFKHRKLLKEALTHPSCSSTDSTSYQRLEFMGDATLGLAVSNYVFLKYPDFDPGKLSLLRAANISTEKLARVAVRHRLYHYLRHNATTLHEKFVSRVVALKIMLGSIN